MTHWLDTWNTPHVGDRGGEGQVGLVRTHGFSSWVIRLFTRSRVNHMVYDTGTELISAEYPVVRTRPYGHFTNIVWSQFPLSHAEVGKETPFAYAQVGKAYGWMDDLAIGIGILLHDRTPKWIMRWLSNNGEWICSALCDAILRHAGIHVFDDDRPTGSVFPGSFERFFADSGWLPKRIYFSKRQHQRAPAK